MAYVPPIDTSIPRLYLELDVIHVGDPIYIGFENGSGNTDSWIGIYGSTETPGVH